MSLIELKVPDIGGHENVDIIAVEIKVGDTVAVEDTLITLETDKATMDVPAEAAGVVKEVKVKVGDKISEGGVIAVIEAWQPSIREIRDLRTYHNYQERGLYFALSVARAGPKVSSKMSPCALSISSL